MATLTSALIGSCSIATGAWAACEPGAGAESSAACGPVEAAKSGTMQVIQLPPPQGTPVYATVNSDGEVTLSHTPPADVPEADE